MSDDFSAMTSLGKSKSEDFAGKFNRRCELFLEQELHNLEKEKKVFLQDHKIKRRVVQERDKVLKARFAELKLSKKFSVANKQQRYDGEPKSGNFTFFTDPNVRAT